MTYTINKEFALAAGEGDSRLAQKLYVIVHETANPRATGRNEAQYMKSAWQNAYTTYIVGDGIVYEVGEPGYVSWGALNANPYAPVQIELQHTTDPELFAKNYRVYIELIRDSANQFGIPLTLDNGGAGTPGVKSHLWVTNNYGGDHTDPYDYLAEMGISKAQFAKDIANGVGGSDTPFSGWRNDNAHWQWYENGKKVLNAWRQIKGVWYYFGAAGDMATGWYSVSGKWYYSDARGAMKTGWQLINGRWYKLADSGAMTEGWIPSGKIWYYLQADGSMKQGWLKDKSGNWYYLSIPDGHMVTGTQSIDGKEYRFDASGKCLNP